jgi:hypothetical protein
MGMYNSANHTYILYKHQCKNNNRMHSLKEPILSGDFIQ